MVIDSLSAPTTLGLTSGIISELSPRHQQLCKLKGSANSESTDQQPGSIHGPSRYRCCCCCCDTQLEHLGTNLNAALNVELLNLQVAVFYLRAVHTLHRCLFLCLCRCHHGGPRLLKGRDSDGFPQYQERFIRDCIRKFPYCEATLLQQLVRSIAPVEIVSSNTYDIEM